MTTTDVFLQPGELFLSSEPACVKTVVGSCVAIMIRSEHPPLAAIAHCLLPESSAPFDKIPESEALRFVDSTVDLLLKCFRDQGSASDGLEIKIFGGADTGCGYSVGLRNVEAASRCFSKYGLTVAASSIGGVRGRSLQFHTASGGVLVKTLPQRRKKSP